MTSLFFTQRLAVLGQLVLQGIGNATWAALADLHSRGQFALFNRRLIELSRLVAMLAAVGLGPVIAYNHAFFKLWAPGNVAYEGDFIIVVASLNVFLLSLQSLWSWCFSATGQLNRLVPLAVVVAAVNLAVGITLVKPLGVVGPLLGTSVSLGLIGHWVLPLQLRTTFGTDLWALAKATLPSFVWGCLSAYGFWWFARSHEPNSWLGLALAMSLAAIASMTFGIVALLTSEERSMWRGRLIPARFQRKATS